MKIITEKNVAKFIIYLFIIIMSLMVISISYYYVKNAYDDFQKDSEQFVQDYYNTQKQNIKKEVEVVLDIIKYQALIATPENEQSIKEEVVRMLHNISFQEGKSNYVFVYEVKDLQGGDEFAVMLVNPNRPDLLGKSISSFYEDETGKRFREEFLNDIRVKGESFTQYAYKKPYDDTIKQKLSYFKYFQEWNWIVAVGIYLDDIEQDIEHKKALLKSKVQKRVAQTIFIFLGFLTVAIAFSILVSQKIEEFFDEYKQTVQKKSEDLIELNINLEKRVQEELSKNREKEQILIQKSKFIALGEMISNIAHQWRQPLSELSSVLMAIKFKYSMGKLEPAFMQKKVEDADNLIEYMSHTIDDFRNFFMPKKEKELFSLYSSVQSVMNILGSMLKENQIVVNVNIDPSIMLNTYLNECEQVILNIISNAKDVLVSNNVKDAHIDIFALEDEHFVKLTIEDNGGGIQVQPKSKIFEPYFTTKDDAHGTGIGLYMSKIIVEKNMRGKLRVKNSSEGAQFSIFIPKK
ncbi:MAG: cache domain-containing protein [Arcobacteraceae bacterium]|jgi:C4-dicarboxylate-specific signal transduction histidine kinase|nr:cache domain-containing protein [Arcobacteraceae bacterium]